MSGWVLGVKVSVRDQVKVTVSLPIGDVVGAGFVLKVEFWVVVGMVLTLKLGFSVRFGFGKG